MKKFTITLIFALLVISKTWAQQISTDPANPINEERPELTNNFNWMDRLLTVYHPDGGYVDGNDNPIQLGSPYFEREEYQNHFNLFNYDLSLPPSEEADNLYFHPKDGWELLHKNNGFESDESTLITDPLINRVGPYLMLYNRYTGRLRVLASFDGIGENDNIVTTLKFKHPTTAAPNLAYNAMFNNYGTFSQPLDQQTDVIEISEASKAAINRGFVSSDFQMSYDPCACETQSELIADFATLNDANMTLEGRLIATSVPLDGSGNSPLLNREDFLTQVYKDGFTVNGGMLTYKNIDALVEKYEQPQLSAFEKTALEIFKGAINGTASAIDKSKIVKKGQAIGLNWLLGDSYFNEEKGVGLGIFAAGAKSLTAELFPDHSIPSVSFIEGEMVLTGTLEDETPLNNGSINLAVPGSSGSQNVQWQFYPTYNKPLGLFALLETPNVIRYNQEGNRSNGLTSYHAFFKFQEGLDYAFNPNSNIDVENTEVLGALELTMIGDPNDVDNASKNLHVISEKDLENGEKQVIYITPFMPIENLQDVVPKFFYRKDCDRDPDRGWDCNNSQEFRVNIKTNLKIMIEYQFQKNSYGKVNSTVQVYTYPVNITTVNKDEDDEIPNYIDLNSISNNYTWPLDGTFTPSQSDLNVWEKISISKEIILSQTYLNGGGTFKMKADEIHLTNGAHIGPGITLKAGLPLIDRVDSQPKNESYIANFCRTAYRGQEYSGIISTNSRISGLESTNLLSTQEASILDSLSNGITIYPNPNSGKFQIDFEDPATSCHEVKILSSANELRYHKIVKGSINDLEIDLNLPLGDNYVKFYFNEGIVTKRIWIQ